MRKFQSENLKDRVHMEYLGVDGEGLDWIHVAFDKNQQRVVVNRVMNLGFYKRRRIASRVEFLKKDSAPLRLYRL